MYKVEYLILLDKEKTKCKTKDALKNLLQVDSNITINKNRIYHDGFESNMSIQQGKNTDSNHIFFNIAFNIKNESDIEKFTILLKAVRSSLKLITNNQFVIWDDVSKYYSEKGYPIVFNIENLMRQLITKFMLTNVGIGWTKERMPTEVLQSKNSENNDLNYLNNIDFIQLNNFLFSDNYPNHKENLIKELKKAKDFSMLNLDEIKSLLPESNWDKYFEPLVGCEAEYLEKRWKKLYTYRCQIAHNKPFSKHDLKEVDKLVSELEPHLVKAMESLNKIDISEEEKENVAENVAISFNEAYGSFIRRFKRLENLLFAAANHHKVNSTGTKLRPFGVQTGILRDNGIIDNSQYSELKTIYYSRSKIVHSDSINNLTIPQLKHEEKLIENYIYFFQNYLINLPEK